MSETISGNTTTSYITLSANATLSVEPGATLTGTGGAAVLAGTLASGVVIENQGVITAPPVSTSVGSGSFGVILGGTGSTLNNAASASIIGYTNGAVLNLGAVVDNAGTILASGTAGGLGLVIVGGALGNSSGALISGYSAGALIGGGSVGGAGTVINAGTLQSTARQSGSLDTTQDSGLALGHGGTVVNNGVITGYKGVGLSDGGVVTNAQGTIQGSSAIYVVGTVGYSHLINTALVDGSHFGINIESSGAASQFISNTNGTIESSGTAAIYAGTAASTITIVNQGLIADTAVTRSGIALGDGGAVTNMSGATITGSDFGVFIDGPQSSGSTHGTIANFGTISVSMGIAVELGIPGLVTNDGVILGGAVAGVVLAAGGTLVNTATIDTGSFGGAGIAMAGNASLTNSAHAVISGGLGVKAGSYAAISNAGNPLGATIINAGTISGVSTGIAAYQGGLVTNAAGGTISINNGLGGLSNPTEAITAGAGREGALTLTNAGLISADVHTGSGVFLNDGGAVSNAASGTIIAYVAGVASSYGSATLSNAGTIEAKGSALFQVQGTATSSIGVDLGASGIVTNAAGGVISGAIGAESGTIINAGTIASSLGNTGTAVAFGNFNADVVIDPGARFIGAVNAYGNTFVTNNTIELASANSIGTISGIGSHYTDFQTITEDAGARWQIDGTIGVAETITIGQGAMLAIGSAVASGVTIDFAAGSGALVLSDPAQFSGTIGQIAPGDTIDFTSLPYQASDQATLASNNALEVINAGAVLAKVQLNPVGQYSGLHFNLLQDGTGSAIVPCFARGTRIRTKRGEIAVEALKVGDQVMVLGGGVRPVRWIGRRRIDLARHPRPETVRPVRILAEAFGPGLPARDLVVSPGHALFVAGALIPAEYLVNGATIIREDVDEVAYFHVELDHHAVLFSENLPSESYLDRGNRAAFENSAGVVALHPDFTAHDGAGACLPLVLAGEKLAAARRRLLGRVPALGFAVDEDPDLHLRRDGRRIEAVRREAGWHDFLLPAATREVRLVSHVAVPAAVRHSPDWRTLGVRIDAVFLNERFVPLENPIFRAGFHGVERQGDRAWRWSDGHGILPLPPSPTPTALRLKIGESLPHWQNPATARRAISPRTGRA